MSRHVVEIPGRLTPVIRIESKQNKTNFSKAVVLGHHLPNIILRNALSLPFLETPVNSQLQASWSLL